MYYCVSTHWFIFNSYIVQYVCRVLCCIQIQLYHTHSAYNTYIILPWLFKYSLILKVQVTSKSWTCLYCCMLSRWLYMCEEKPDTNTNMIWLMTYGFKFQDKEIPCFYNTLQSHSHYTVNRRARLELELVFLNPDGIRAVINMNEAILRAQPHGGLLALRVITTHLRW